MYSRVNYMVVGIFVLLFGIGLVWFAFWLGKYGMSESYYTYKIEVTESVSGLSIDSDVMLRGVDIGKVKDIRINPENIEFTEIYIDILQEVPIKEDMVASTKMFGITGLLSIEIVGGTNTAKTLQPTDTYIPVIKTQPSFVTTLSNNVESLSEKLNTLMAKSEKLLSDENLENVEKILANVEKFTQGSEQLKMQLTQSLEELDTTLKTFKTSMNTLSSDVTEVRKVLLPAIRDFNRVTLKVEQDLQKGDFDFKKILEPIIIDMQIMSRQMNDMAKEIEQSPSDIFFKSRKQLKGPGE